MKKIKIKLNYDELNAISNCIEIFQVMKSNSIELKMLGALMITWNMKIQPRLFFHPSPKKLINLTVDVPIACAFVILTGKIVLDASKFEDNLIIKVRNSFQQQLA